MSNPIHRLLQMQINLFNDKFSLLILLTGFVGFGVSPTDHGFASIAKNVTNAVHSCDEKTVLRWARCDVYALVEQIRSSMSSMKTFAYDIIMARQVRTTLSTCVNLGSIQVNHAIFFFYLSLQRSHFFRRCCIGAGGIICAFGLTTRRGFGLIVFGTSACLARRMQIGNIAIDVVGSRGTARTRTRSYSLGRRELGKRRVTAICSGRRRRVMCR
mmetsp:Transcript_469/g.715  ORF Transcript_469/g.715 Transcript_469/m.715 type:complete len:214 (-) Transcript_469:200-841(-)